MKSKKKQILFTEKQPILIIHMVMKVILGMKIIFQQLVITADVTIVAVVAEVADGALAIVPVTFGGGIGMQYGGPSPEGAKYPCASHLAYQRVSMSAGEKFLSMVTVFVAQFAAVGDQRSCFASG